MKQARSWFLVVIVAVTSWSVGAAAAGSFPKNEVPPALRDWIPWVLHGEMPKDCPVMFSNASAERCQWPSVLKISVDRKQATFSQSIWNFQEEKVLLPGGQKLWPMEVQVDGRKLPVGEENNKPVVLIAPGAHTINGQFEWEELPEWVEVPVETGLVQLTVQGKEITFPNLDEQGRLWFKETPVEQTREEDRMDLTVDRRLEDSVPLLIETRVKLNVSGKNREVLLGKALLPNLVPMKLESKLPVRLEPDGRLRVQVRPGEWIISLLARHKDRVEALQLDTPIQPWPEEEVWVFQAHPDLRSVEVLGPPPIDPQLTTLPAEWKTLPAYLLKPGVQMRLSEQRRGETINAIDELQLSRTLWLDFDGQGLSVKDEIQGSIMRNWRLEAAAPLQLGRVVINNIDQLVTKMDNNPKSGVEVREGRIRLQADSRIDKRPHDIPISGWDQDFIGASASLNLPPGWRLLNASGVDKVDSTWITRWTLLDLFLALVIAFGVAKLFSWLWGAVALVVMMLTIHESAVLPWIWPNLLVAIALLKVLPKGWFRFGIQIYRILCLITLALVALPFMVQQIRVGLYPQLGTPDQLIDYREAPQEIPDRFAQITVSNNLADGEQVAAFKGNEGGKLEERHREASVRVGAKQGVSLKSMGYGNQQQIQNKRLLLNDPNARIQTGAGIPEWNWTQVRLSWNGPISKNQTMSLWLLPPWANLLLAILRVVALLALFLCVLPIRKKPGSAFALTWTKPLGLVLVCLCVALGGFPSRAHAQNNPFPSKEMLEELKSKLIERESPACRDQCASISRLEVEVNQTSLRLRLEVHSLAKAAVPLPGKDLHFIPQSVWLDGEKAQGLRRESNSLWILVPLGQHQILMEGAVPSRDSFLLPLPLKPHRVTIRAQGFEVDGVSPDGTVDETLQFRRKIRPGNEKQKSETSLEMGMLPPFIRVERTLRLDLTWTVDTQVIRLTPLGSVVSLEIPLLAGEAISTEGVRVENGKVMAQLGPQQQQLTWSSTLERQNQVVLKAPDLLHWSEIWQLSVGPVWHVNAQGIPAVHQKDAQGDLSPQWQPWPGEKVTLAISRPEGVEGKTITIESSRLQLQPGQRVTNADLNLKIRASRGEPYSIKLPEGAEAYSLKVNEITQPVHQDKNSLSLSLQPGTQNIVLKWRQEKELSMLYKTPAVDLGSESVNTNIQAHIPEDRWILFVGGPRLGPAVLFWGGLLVVMLLALALGFVRSLPLRSYHWLLLGIGLLPVSLLMAIPIILWFLLLAFRSAQGNSWKGVKFWLLQTSVILMTMVALGALVVAIEQGLLSYPDMYISGNGSYGNQLHWFQDRLGATMPSAWVLSVPLFWYRLLMLGWALWLAYSFIKWARWGWKSFSQDGLLRWSWKTTPPKKPEQQVKT